MTGTGRKRPVKEWSERHHETPEVYDVIVIKERGTSRNSDAGLGMYLNGRVFTWYVGVSRFNPNYCKTNP